MYSRETVLEEYLYRGGNLVKWWVFYFFISAILWVILSVFAVGIGLFLTTGEDWFQNVTGVSLVLLIFSVFASFAAIIADFLKTIKTMSAAKKVVENVRNKDILGIVDRQKVFLLGILIANVLGIVSFIPVVAIISLLGSIVALVLKVLFWLDLGKVRRHINFGDEGV